MSDMIPAEKIREVIAGLRDDDTDVRESLEALLPAPKTVADELRALADSCEKQANSTESTGVRESFLQLDGEIGLLADRVETLEQERDELTYAREEGRAAADNWTNTARRLEEAQAEIARLEGLEVPGGWRVATHDHFGPHPKQEPEHIDPASCGRYRPYLVKIDARETQALRVDDDHSPWMRLFDRDYHSDKDVLVLRPLTPEEMDAR